MSNMKDLQLKHEEELDRLHTVILHCRLWLTQYSNLLDEICDGPLNCPNEDLEQYFGDWAEVHKDRGHIKQFIKELKDED